MVSSEVPPRAVVISWSTPILNDNPFSKVAKYVISKWTPPRFTLLVDSDTHMWAAKREECMDLEAFALLYDCSCNKATLGNTDNAHLLIRKVWVVVDLVAHRLYLPLHSFEYRSRIAVPDFDAFDHCLALDLSLDVGHPRVDLMTVSIKAVKDEHRSYCIILNRLDWSRYRTVMLPA